MIHTLIAEQHRIHTLISNVHLLTLAPTLIIQQAPVRTEQIAAATERGTAALGLAKFANVQGVSVADEVTSSTGTRHHLLATSTKHVSPCERVSNASVQFSLHAACDRFITTSTTAAIEHASV
jgi:hypothetical protein